MKSHAALLATLFVGLLVASHAALSPEEYWKKTFPNTPMPRTIQESLRSDGDTSVNVGGNGVDVSTGKPGKGTHVNVGTGGVDVNAGGTHGTNVHVGNNGVDVNAGKPGKGTGVHVGDGRVDVSAGKPGKGSADVHVGNGGVDVDSGKPGKGADVHVGNGGVDVNAGKPGKGSADVHVGSGGVDVNAGKPGNGGADVHVGSGGVDVHAGGKGKHVTVTVPGQASPFVYSYAASEDQLHYNPNVALFFLENDLKPGNQMKLHFTKSTNDAAFLPRDQANSIPFSSDKIPEILARFDLLPESDEAKVIKETVRECEEKGIDGEDKHCATSLEEMLDYTSSVLGKDAAVVTTHAEKESPMQNYVFTGVKAMPAATDSVVCHKQNYAYAVFYCHKTRATKTYVVSLVGEDGVKVKAAVVCHTDTSKWNPNHLAFKVLKVHPGTVPICHFLPEDHIVWVRK